MAVLLIEFITKLTFLTGINLVTEQYDEKLVASIQEGKFSEKELINLYDNAIKKGRDDLIVHIKLRLRSDFPRAANRLFGAKQVDAVDKLTILLANITEKYDLSKNTVGRGVKAGGDMVSGRKYLDYYISYKNSSKYVAAFGLVQDAADSELKVVLKNYKTGEDAFLETTIYGMDDYVSATAVYEQSLLKILE